MRCLTLPTTSEINNGKPKFRLECVTKSNSGGPPHGHKDRQPHIVLACGFVRQHGENS